MRAGRRRLAVALVAVALVLLLARRIYRSPRLRTQKAPAAPTLVLVTGYCNCGKCCGWKRNWFGFGEPVYDCGAMRGKPKRIGITATGSRAKRGTIAADPKVYPFGSHLHVPGYGVGTVEDVVGSIKGRHIDVWFPSHAEARRWGARWLKVETVR